MLIKMILVATSYKNDGQFPILRSFPNFSSSYIQNRWATSPSKTYQNTHITPTLGAILFIHEEDLRS